MTGEHRRDDPSRPLRAGFSTRAIHNVRLPEVRQEPSSIPIYQSSTWRFESLEDFAEVISGNRPGHVYGRGYGNPTVEAFEAVMADLEQTDAAFAYDSGMGAIYAVTTALAESGDRIVASRELYGGTYSLFHDVLPRYGITTQFVDVGELEAVAAALPGARMFYVETIANPTLTVADLATLGGMCAAAGVAGVIDNTFASPWGCNPAAFGFEYVLHSATKYIGGHSDLVGGVVCSSTEARRTLRQRALDTGGAMQPFEAWLCLRGLATLELRMQRHCATATGVAEMLSGSEAVATTHYPGLVTDPCHDLARSLLRGFGGMVAFVHRDGLQGARRFCEALELAWLAASLGGDHTLVAHPASTTHRQMAPEQRRGSGIADGLVRVSIGLEDPDDVYGDLAQALRRSLP